MAKNQKNKIDIRLWIIGIAILVFSIIVISLIGKLNTNKSEEMAKAKAKFIKTQTEKVKSNLSGMSEQERMTFYCADFFKMVDTGRFEEAYDLLYSEYKENYFPTFNNFKKYFEDNFPDNFSLKYTNIERLGSIYIMWVSVTDNVNGSKYGHNFEMNVVIQENGLNDYVISFSRDSAVKSSTGEEG